MRTVIAIAVTSAFAIATLAGCAVIVVPDDGNGNARYTSWGGNAVEGNGVAAVERREAGNTDGLDINGPMQVEVRVGSAPSLQVEGDSNLLPMLKTDASGGTLRVWVEGNIRSSNPLRVIYTTPQLRQISSNGSGRLAVSGLNGGALNLNQNGSRQVQLAGAVSQLEARLNGSGSVNAAGLEIGSAVASLNGSGRLDLGRLRGDSLSLDLHGSGGVNASGNVRTMNVRLYGSGSADLAGLTSQSAELSTHGSGSVSATVSQSLVADSTGSGHVTVYGNPSQRSVSGKRVSVMQ
ncbi:head GIN domain-containing protein [Duganella sp. Dugasp56]|uniref:head GIN domain-containing protein n=1 Tax=Duganella sp. Dugasp56 TaxID=3243046 RepID=UPI0039B1197F